MNKIAFIFLLLIGSFSQAQTIISDRPTKSVRSTVIPKSSLQVETGMSAGFTPGGGQAINRIIAPSSLFRFGVSEYFELRILTQFESFKSPFDLNRTSGMSDLQIGTKIRLLDKEGEDTKVSWLTQIAVPTGSRGITTDLYVGINSLAISHVLSENMSLSYNLGYDFYLEKNGNLTYSVALVTAVNDKVSFFVEPYGQYTRLLTYEASFDAGLTYLIKENLQMDFSFGSGLNHKMNFLGVGFSWNTAKTEK
ncbi:MAG: hypothetical protein ACJA0Q_001882 [Saprospiraceae bacterium]|jgi:hypothetical protein